MTRLLRHTAAFLLWTTSALARPDCEALARNAERQFDLPAGLLVAIARTESGRGGQEGRGRAWPWTMNVAGKGSYYDSRAEALAAMGKVLAGGEEFFDIGCMQLNWYWHGDHFRDLDSMLDPARNVAYAARFLADLSRETRSWDAAVRFYHSRDPARGAAYLERVRGRLADVRDEPAFLNAPLARSVIAWTAAPPGAAPGPPDDRRFEQGVPLVPAETATPYWNVPSLGEGGLPSFAPQGE